MNFKKILEENKVWHKFIKKPDTVHTADAARVSGIDLKRITKSLVLIGDGSEAIMVIIPGDSRIAWKKLKKVSGCREIKLAEFNKAQKYSGYLPGATPPVFHKRKMKVFVDKKLLRYKTIYGGGGNRKLLVELKTEDVINLNNAEAEDLTLSNNNLL